MKRYAYFLAVILLGAVTAKAQNAQNDSDPLAAGAGAVATVIGETRTALDSVTTLSVVDDRPEWKKKLYYGYNFDIYWHHDSKANTKENGWSIAIEPEIGWKLKERLYIGMRVGGSYQNTLTTYSYTVDTLTISQDLRVMRGTWEVTPYVRYRLKSFFNDKLGIWLEAHLYTGMEFPRVIDGNITGTDYDGLKYNVTYGVQVSPVITYQFSRKRSFQIFFSIMSFGYSGTARIYADKGNEYTNDIIIFSGKLRNLLANQFTPGLYGLKFGVQKSF